MLGLNLFQKAILRFIPFRLNLYLQLKVLKNGISFVGMNDKQRTIAWEKYSKLNPPPEPHYYGPPFQPPWLQFPDYEMFSMGFRMGSGEDYAHQFSKWYNSASIDEVKCFKQEYPEAENYLGYYDMRDKWRDEYRVQYDPGN